MAKKEEWNNPTKQNEDFEICATATAQMVDIVKGIETTGKEEQGISLEVNGRDLMNGNVQRIQIEKESHEEIRG